MTGQFKEIDRHAGNGQVIVVILVRGQPEDRKISFSEQPEPVLPLRPDQFITVEEFALDEQR